MTVNSQVRSIISELQNHLNSSGENYKTDKKKKKTFYTGKLVTDFFFK